MPKHQLYCMQIHVDGGSEINVPDLISAGDDLEYEIDQEVTSNETAPSHIGMLSRENTRQVTCYALKTLLDQIAPTGLAILTTLNPGVSIISQKFDDLGQPEAGSVHRSLTTKYGWVVPRTLTCDHRGHAQLALDIVAIKKPSSEVIVLSDVAPLPTITISPARWTLGPITLGGVVLSKFRQLEIDFGMTVTGESTESNVDNEHIEVRTQTPQITVNGIDAGWFASVGIDGIVGSHANCNVVLRKRTGDGANAGFVDPATAEHISITSAGLLTSRNIGGQQSNQPSEHSLVLTCAKDSAGNNPLIIDTDYAY